VRDREPLKVLGIPLSDFEPVAFLATTFRDWRGGTPRSVKFGKTLTCPWLPAIRRFRRADEHSFSREFQPDESSINELPDVAFD